MTTAARERRPGGTGPSLLVSVHDVSPLTLEACKLAVALAIDAGVPARELTLLVIPRHEDRAPLDEHEATCAWLASLAAGGATLVMHGYTHRMAGRSLTPAGLVWAHGFARGQGELYRATADETHRRLEAGAQILRRAGLGRALRGFVPPAWLLSTDALAAVRRAGFSFYEVLGGIVVGERRLARRVIGLGSLNGVEALVTSAFAAYQSRRAPTDTRLAIHPQDLGRPASRRSLERALRRLLAGHVVTSYERFLGLEA